MKTARTNLLITLTVAFLTLLSFAPTYSGAQDKKPTLSKKELKVLLRTAKEPPEHRGIADYYRQQAERLTNSSKEHQELATIYENKNTVPSHGVEAWHFIRTRR
jgi:S-100/ICaBP type calcium binding domain